MEPANRSAPLDDALNARLLAALPPRNTIEPRARIVDYEIVEMAVLFRTGELTSVQITVAYLNRISTLNGPFETYDENGGYNAFVRIDANEAMQQAALADAWIASQNDPRGPAPPLCGIPLGAKDVIAIKGRECKNGTHAFDTNVALEDATIIARLRAQGAVLLGHTICSAYSQSTDGDFGGNAWDPARVPGGSSSGSGIAPVARLCAAALAEETGGSLVIPAAANGASGIKPSLGLTSTAGMMPLSTGWDVPGVIARSIRDASLIMAVISGVDQFNDPLTLSGPIPALVLPISPSTDEKPLTGLTIGIPQTDWMYRPGQSETLPPADTYDRDYREAFERFKQQLVQLGAAVIEFPGLDMRVAANCPYYRSLTLYPIEVGGITYYLTQFLLSLQHARYETHYWSAGAAFAQTRPEPYRTELLGFFNVPTEHELVERVPYDITLQSQERRREQQALWQKALDDYQVDFMLVMPLGSHIGLRYDPEPENGGLRVKRSTHDLPNSLGWPMVTLPIGYGQTGVGKPLPITAAFWGTRFSEVQIIQAAIDYQHHHPLYHNEAPPDPDLPTLARPPGVPRVKPITPDSSTDPAVIERGPR